MTKHIILFAPSLKEVTGGEGETILQVAREAGIYLNSHCNGKGNCGKCKVRIVEGNVSPFTTEEERFIKPADKEYGYRLACKARVLGDLTVFVAGETIFKPHSGEKVFSKGFAAFNPPVRAYCIELPENNHERRGHMEALMAHLEENEGLHNLTADITALQNLVKAEKAGNGKITVYVRLENEILAVQPGWETSFFGLALDVGTTTLALYLCDLRNGDVIATGSVTNPQVLFGSDIMSRVSYSVDHPAVGVRRMQKELVDAINVMVEKMVSKNDHSAWQIMDMTMVGNTVMHHIFLGIAPDHLGRWPFTPSIQGPTDIKARDLGLRINPAAYVHVLPVEAGFVGADNVGVLISEEPYNLDELSLVIDLGTNGELALGNRTSLASCSCATGPAFEGAQIAHGMRAAEGAIERVRIDPTTHEVDYGVIGKQGWSSEHEQGALKPVGLCGSAIIDTVAHLLKSGLIGSNGAFTNHHKTARLRAGQSGIMEFVLAWKEETGIESDIVITQKDVRQVQLAKGALYSGCKVLMKHFGVDTVNRMVVAGAFGLHIDKENALTIGLFPWIAPEKIDTVGNAAGHGAYLALIDREKRSEAARIARFATHIELALERDFQKEFISSLNFPEQR